MPESGAVSVSSGRARQCGIGEGDRVPEHQARYRLSITLTTCDNWWRTTGNRSPGCSARSRRSQRRDSPRSTPVRSCSMTLERSHGAKPDHALRDRHWPGPACSRNNSACFLTSSDRTVGPPPDACRRRAKRLWRHPARWAQDMHAGEAPAEPTAGQDVCCLSALRRVGSVTPRRVHSALSRSVRAPCGREALRRPSGCCPAGTPCRRSACPLPQLYEPAA